MLTCRYFVDVKWKRKRNNQDTKCLIWMPSPFLCSVCLSVSHSAERNLQRPHGLFIWIANETQIHFKLNSVFFLFSNPLLLDSLNYSFSLELAKVLKLKNLRGKLETIFAVILSLPPFQLWHQHYLLPGLLQ